jgi:hypothetical protein
MKIQLIAEAQRTDRGSQRKIKDIILGLKI